MLIIQLGSNYSISNGLDEENSGMKKYASDADTIQGVMGIWIKSDVTCNKNF